MGEERWHQCPGVGATDSGDRVVVLALTETDPAPRILDGMSAAVWRSLAAPLTERELVAGLLAAYDVPLEQVQDHVRSILAELDRAGVACTGSHDQTWAPPVE